MARSRSRFRLRQDVAASAPAGQCGLMPPELLPSSPQRRARPRSHARKPTPCTRPRTRIRTQRRPAAPPSAAKDEPDTAMGYRSPTRRRDLMSRNARPGAGNAKIGRLLIDQDSPFGPPSAWLASRPRIGLLRRFDLNIRFLARVPCSRTDAAPEFPLFVRHVAMTTHVERSYTRRHGNGSWR